MMVHFIGAGPGAPDLLTLRGAELIATCPVVLYAGSLVPAAVVVRARPGSCVLDTAGMTFGALHCAILPRLEIAQRLVKPLCPDVSAVMGSYKLGVDSNCLA